MIPGRHDFSIYQGGTFAYKITAKDKEGLSVDFSKYTGMRLQARELWDKSNSNTPLININMINGGIEKIEGNLAIQLNLSSEETTALNFEIGKYDLELSIGQKCTLQGGTPYSEDVAVWKAITDGGFKINIDGTDHNFTGMNFSTITQMSDIPAIVNLVTGIIITCSYVDNKFKFIPTEESELDDPTLSFMMVPDTGQTLANLLGGTEIQNASIIQYPKIIDKLLYGKITLIPEVNA